MTFPGQSAKLWSVLGGVVVSAALLGCAGSGEIGRTSGSGGDTSGAAGSTGAAGSHNPTGVGGAGNPTGAAGAGNPTGAAGSGNPTGAGGAGNPTGAGGSGNSTGAGGSGSPVYLRASIRRLTNAEYDASVQALLGTTQSPSQNFPPDSRQAGGFTLNDAQRVDPVLAKALDDAALALVAEARGNNKLATLAPCSNSSTMGQTCAQTFIKSFGAKAYRRQLTSDEVTALTTLYTTGSTGGTYNDGIDLVTRGLLESAGFLYVTQLGSGSGSPLTLTSDELASNLSYLVSGAPPDQTLLDASTAGSLATADGRETQARRLLGTTAGKARMVRVVREWLGTDAIDNTGKDATAYAAYAGAKASIVAESSNFVAEVLQNSTGSVNELLSANWSVIDSTLAGVYGVTSAGTGKHTALPNRLGILNQAAFLSVYAHASESGPVLRGVAIMRKIACMDLPSPSSLNIVVVPPMPDPSKSTRDRFSVHATDAKCASCHGEIDSIGFAFELFDGMGQQRAKNGDGSYQEVTSNGMTVKTTTATTVPNDFTSDFTGTYADSNALAMGLANSADVRECVARQMFRSSAGRGAADMTSAADQSAVAGSEQTFLNSWSQLSSANQGKFAEMLVAYVRSPLFDKRSTQ
jgi:hypothetical protein